MLGTMTHDEGVTSIVDVKTPYMSPAEQKNLVLYVCQKLL
jgi:hypothetical protein